MGWLGSGLGIAYSSTPAVIVAVDVFGALGTGVLLLANCAHGLLRARGIVQGFGL